MIDPKAMIPRYKMIKTRMKKENKNPITMVITTKVMVMSMWSKMMIKMIKMTIWMR